MAVSTGKVIFHKTKSFKIIGIILYCISPLIGLFYFIRGIARKEIFAFYLLGAFFALFGAYLVPDSDAFSYREIYYSNVSFNYTILSIENKDFLYPLLSTFFNKLGFSFEAYRFLLLLFSYSSYIWMLLDIFKNNPNLTSNKKTYLYATYAMFFSVRLFTLAYGIRFGFASTIVVISLYLFYKKSYLKAIIFYLISTAMHFSILLILPLIIYSFIASKLKIRPFMKIMIILLLCVFANSAIEKIILTVMPNNELVQSVAEGYISGDWGTNSMIKLMSIGGLLFTIARILPIFPLGYFVLKDKTPSFLSNLSFAMIALLCVSFSSITILLRYSNIAIAISFLTMLVTYTANRKSFYKLKVALFSFLFVFANYIYAQRVSLSVGYQFEAICFPLLVIDQPPYTDKWVNNNINIYTREVKPE